MAVKICTTGGACIKCEGQTVTETVNALEELEKAGKKYYCCIGVGTRDFACVRVDKVTTVSPARLSDDDDDDGRPILGSPDIVILTGGQKALRKRRRRRAEPADAEPATPDDEVAEPATPDDEED